MSQNFVKNSQRKKIQLDWIGSDCCASKILNKIIWSVCRTRPFWSPHFYTNFVWSFPLDTRTNSLTYLNRERTWNVFFQCCMIFVFINLKQSIFDFSTSSYFGDRSNGFIELILNLQILDSIAAIQQIFRWMIHSHTVHTV